MKRIKTFLIIAAILLASLPSHSQSTAASNVPGFGRFLGFNGAQNLEFRTNNITRMTLTQTTGLLGIGIAAPASLLHLSTSATGDLFRSNGPTNGDNRWQLFTSNTERFRVRTLAGGFDTYLERTQPGSEADIRLLTAQVEVRARNKSFLMKC